ncbi:sarcosine oxidase subunit gamma [Rhodobacteraceae bacterium HSP-20]|uniref:Sarcosine oxidase subunit gamma n=1 Tax=Paragemmobacter amnigenus TaxID=2852097 RepID=A0ABS6J6Y8_9RHOB|nr:sarcosine oxidase subunit gamma family protein [Rhodobacter amnigenus]MBU9699508.1 sarcosine oxidase subunit gamma [Rhodobacter amnigenus]MBV4390735.1 sarcosine oxidase subunit gamma [Rhodobacter amnigenus]
MSEPVSALKGATAQGFATIREIGPVGMITLRAKPDVKALAKAIKAAVGTEVPALRRIVTGGDRACGWMSPDEYLLVMPYAAVAGALEAIAKAMGGEHHLAVDVSDARAVFRVEGAKAEQVLAKLSPVDFATLEPGELRRTRAAQVAAAFWKDGDGFTVVCFRSVGRYVFDLLATGAKPGSELA